jgi:ABC-type Zn uptake system ZnuABC Zn-binding protein ZnuA
MKRYLLFFTFLFIAGLGNIGLMGCASPVSQTHQPGDDRLAVVATTTFIGDVINRVAGDEVDLSTLLEPGQNPHSFQPTPRDLILVSEADLIFVNGLGLEEFLEDILEGADTTAPVIIVSEGISPLESDDNSDEDEVELHHDHDGQDPHVWLDPNNVKIWVENIAESLTEADPGRAGIYQSNAEAYRDELDQLDVWIRDQVEQIPPENRKLVTDHTTFGYFADEYGFTQMGAMILAMTTEAETSGQQLAGMVDRIRNYQVKAIFVGADTDPTLSQRIAEETGVQLVPLYFGSLTDGDPAGTYLNFMRYNVTQVVEALK